MNDRPVPGAETVGHPGAGRVRARSVPKGRQIDPAALDEVRTLLGDRPLQRDLLIEYLHLINDRFGQLPAAHLAALAEEMGLAQAEVYETATFYAHFDVVKEGDPALPPLVVRVCDSVTCDRFGADKLLAALQASPPGGVRVLRAPCLGMCYEAPVVEVGHHFVRHATEEAVRGAVAAGDIHTETPHYVDYNTYRAHGGYAVLDRLRAGKMSAEEVLGILDGGLRGMGGAGFPTARKWRSVMGEPAPRLMAVNADEGEPGTFKDRYFLNTDPHRVLEGTLIAATIIDAADIYFYLRDEYPAARKILERELARLPADWPRIHLRRGAGAYICGEESSMIESIEGKRGMPRQKPPFPFQVGIFDRPTLINNVETLYWIRDIVEKGAAWWTSHGRNGGAGLRSYSVSGRVRNPGVKIAPAGLTVRELIEEECGGMAEGHRFAAYLPGGASGGMLPASLGDIPLDFGKLEKYGCFIGSAAVVIFSDKDDLRAAVLNLTRFFEDESCGQCTPCRVGTQKTRMLLEREVWDRALIEELAEAMRDASICGLGQSASNPVLSLLRWFDEKEIAGGVL